MSKAKFIYAHISTWGEAPKVSVELEINGKRTEISGMPASNELIKELTALFKRHLPKAEDI